MKYIVFYDRDWTWVKFPTKPSQETIDALKARWQARWTWGKEAWYIQEWVPIERLVEVLGEPIGTVEGRAPTKTWEYCMQLVQLAMPGMEKMVDPKTITPPKEKAPKGNPKLAAKFRAMADKMQKEIDYKRRPLTQNPTPKRLKELASRHHDAANLERGQAALRALADAYEDGAVPDDLYGVTTKADILPMVRTRWASYGYYEGGDSGEFADTSKAAKLLQAMITGVGATKEELEIERREAKAILSIGQIPGFFPTPEDIARKLVSKANIRAGTKVLEPSAGSGNIADVIKALHPDVELDVIERNYNLAELLKLKGHNLIGSDFLEVDGDRRWDVIIQNPPFENGQDIDHVRHAYDLLEENGVLVSVMCVGPFFREDRKAKGFREWLDQVGYHLEELGSGAFNPHTPVATNIVVIEK